MELITQKELSKRVNVSIHTLSIYFCRPEFLNYKTKENKIIYCEQLLNLIRRFYRPRGNGGRYGINKERATSPKTVLLQQ